VNLVFRPNKRGQKPIGLSFCNQDRAALNHRLRRLKRQWDATKGADLGTLVLLRSADEWTTQNNDGGFKELTDAGAFLIRPDRQQLAELAAFQALLSKSLDGDLTRHGRLVDVSEYCAWAEVNLSDAVKELFQQILEPDSPQASSSLPAATTQAAKPKPAKKQGAARNPK
jgi:hypothetical protein